jgi:hypothetical protein
MVGWLVNDKLKLIKNENLVVYFMYYTIIFRDELRKIRRVSVRIAYLWAKIEIMASKVRIMYQKHSTVTLV